MDQFGHKPGPAGLMARTQAGTVVPVKILVEQKIISKVGVILKKSISTVDRPLTMAITQK
jgi:hypothetical protein